MCVSLTMSHTDTDIPFAALAHRRRRGVLSCVSQHHVVTLADLADELAVQEHGATIDGVPADAVRELYLELYHNHVPTLADADLVVYDQDQDLVTITPAGTAAYTYLEEEVYEFSERTSRPPQDCLDEGSC